MPAQPSLWTAGQSSFRRCLESLPNWRPFFHRSRGRVSHPGTGAAEPYEKELALGWICHHLYGVILALVMGAAWLTRPTFLPAWIFAIITIAAGSFLSQLGLGIGWAASRTLNPTKVRALGHVARAFFGIGLYGTAVIRKGLQPEVSWFFFAKKNCLPAQRRRSQERSASFGKKKQKPSSPSPQRRTTPGSDPNLQTS